MVHSIDKPAKSACDTNGCLPQVLVYVDGKKVGEAPAVGATPHHIIHRLCEIDLTLGERAQQPPQPQQMGVGFHLKLPMLNAGKHEASS